MKAGKLRNLITIQSRDSGEDAAGQPLQTWTDVASVWADILGANGMQTIKAPLDGVEINSYSFRIRYREDINAGMRVVSNGQHFDVKQVRLDMARKEWADLICQLGGNEG